jgi:ubiquinone/menaquinone biosynthesis C-methylase UbiE
MENMSIIKVNNSTEKYEQIAKNLRYRNELTGRGNDHDLTKLRSKNICTNIKNLNLRLQTFVDVGCGDGSFLVETKVLFDSSIGILPTYSEVVVVSNLMDAELSHIEIKQGLTTKIPEGERSIDFLLCNSVLHGVGFNSKLVDESLCEFKRVLKPEGFLYVGEIPELNELGDRNYGTSITKYLIWSLKNRGLRHFVRQTVSLLTSLFSNQNYIIQPTNMFFENKKVFRDRLSKHGFEVIKVFESNSNNHVESDTEIKMRRLDYMCKNIS